MHFTLKSYSQDLRDRAHAASTATLLMWATDQSPENTGARPIVTISEGDLILHIGDMLHRRTLLGERDSVLERALEQSCLTGDVPEPHSMDSFFDIPPACCKEGHPDYEFAKGLKCCSKCCKCNCRLAKCSPGVLPHLAPAVPEGEENGWRIYMLLQHHFKTLQLTDESTVRRVGTTDELSQIVLSYGEQVDDERHKRFGQSLTKWFCLCIQISQILGNGILIIMAIVALRSQGR